ncbi:MAG: FtsX-like permease family protein [Bryobacteraceae bacterium]
MNAGLLFYRIILRPLRQERLRTTLTVLAVSLGIASVLAIELAGDAAAGSFRSSMETLLGDSSLEVTAIGGVPPEVVTQIATLPYALKIHPRIEDYASIMGTRKTVPLIGVDLLAESSGMTGDSANQSGGDNLNAQDSIWIGNTLGYKVGDKLKLLINDTSAEFTVRGVLGGNSGDMILMDLAPATDALRRNGRVDRVLIEMQGGLTADQAETILRKALPENIAVQREGTQTDENRRMLEAFRWNLRILSYVALTVGAFLIYNTISVSVVRRRVEIGILRALGVTRTGILAAFLGEAAAFGVLGAMAGVILGRLMASGAVTLVAATVESLYVSSKPGTITLTWENVALAFAIGVVVSLIAAFSPAWEASKVAPVEAMARGRREHKTRIHTLRSLAFAALFAAAGWFASQQEAVGGKPVFGYGAAILLIAASALAIPALVAGLSTATSGILKALFGAEALLASRNLAASLRRTSVLVGALSTALSMLVAVGIMVGSFRETVIVWMDDRLQADLYLRPAVPPGADRHPTMGADVVGVLEKLPEVEAVDQFRGYEISYQGAPATLGAGVARIAGRYGNRPLLSGASPQTVFPRLEGQDAVIVSEPFANKHNVRAGDVLMLPLAKNRVAFKVLDVYYDYSNERGFIIMDRSTLLKYLPDPAPSNVAVYLKKGVPLEAGKQSVDAALAGREIFVAPNVNLRREAIRIFDRTFAITYALEAVAIFVAIMGVGGALVALVIDRRREYGLLRFLGAGAGQLRRIILFEAGLLGILANIAGMLLGFFLSLLLIYVINKQSFGWTIQFHWPVRMLLSGLSLVYAATLVAALYPARIATQLVPMEVIHED